MRNQKLFVHVPFPKTGSTVLQEKVFPTLQSPNLKYRGKFGKHRCAKGDHWINVHNFVFYGKLEFERSACREIENTRGSSLISNEDFLNPFGFRYPSLAPLFVGEFERLDRLFSLIPSDIEVSLIVTFRRQENWIRSFHLECLKQGYYTNRDCNDFINYLDSNDDWIDRNLNYHRLFNSLKERYSRAEVSFIPMEEMLDPSSVFFPRILGINDGPLFETDLSTNVRLKKRGQYVLSKDDLRFLERRFIRQIFGNRFNLAIMAPRLRFLISMCLRTLSSQNVFPMQLETDFQKRFDASNQSFSESLAVPGWLSRFGYFSEC